MTSTAQKPKKLDAKSAWIFPLVAWAVSITVAVSRVKLGATSHLILALFELILILWALYIGIVVLVKKDVYSRTERLHAIVGMQLSGLTIVLILLAIILSLA